MLLTPAASPVTTPALETVTLVMSLETNVKTGCVAKFVPLESLATALHVVVAATTTLFDTQVKAILERVWIGAGVEQAVKAVVKAQ